MPLSVFPLKAKKEDKRFDLFETILNTLDANNVTLRNGDVLVISSKYVSNAQGRVLDLNSVISTKQGKALSKKFQINSNFAEVIVRESDFIYSGISGFVISSSDDILAPNAGIDKSNTKKGKVILYPYDPFLVAEQIFRNLFLKLSVNVGVIIVDSRLMPARVGTTGIAIGCAGIEPVVDLRSQKDLDGNPLKVTFQAVVDNLASIANQQMGEGSDSKPFAIVRDSGIRLTHRKISPSEISVPYDQCVYLRGIKNA